MYGRDSWFIFIVQQYIPSKNLLSGQLGDVDGTLLMVSELTVTYKMHFTIRPLTYTGEVVFHSSSIESILSLENGPCSVCYVQWLAVLIHAICTVSFLGVTLWCICILEYYYAIEIGLSLGQN